MADADTHMLIADMAARARAASRKLAQMTSAEKARALIAAAASIRAASDTIVAANAEDMRAAEASGLSGALLVFYFGTASVGTVVDIAVGVNVIVAAVLGVTRPWQSGDSSTGGQAAPSALGSQAPLAPVLDGVASDAPAPTDQAVAAALQPLLTGGGLGSHVTVGVVDVSSGAQLFGSGEDEPTTPASTMKLATAVSALAVRGPAYQISTRVVAGEQPGEVVLIGGGDPTLAAGSTPAYPGAAKLSDLAAQVKRALNGVAPTKVLVDSSLFTGAKASPHWAPNDVSDGQVSNITALMTDGGRIDPTHSGSPASRYSSPDMAAGRSFAKLLGLPNSAVVRGSAPAGTGSGTPAPDASGAASAAPGTLLGEVKSPPLVRILETMLSSSDNVIAEMMARQVATRIGDEAKVARDFLRQSHPPQPGMGLPSILPRPFHTGIPRPGRRPVPALASGL